MSEWQGRIIPDEAGEVSRDHIIQSLFFFFFPVQVIYLGWNSRKDIEGVEKWDIKGVKPINCELMNCGWLGFNTSGDILRKWTEHTWEWLLWGNRKLNSSSTYLHPSLVEGCFGSTGSRPAPLFRVEGSMADFSPAPRQCPQERRVTGIHHCAGTVGRCSPGYAKGYGWGITRVSFP